MENRARMKELVDILNEASKAYYAKDEEIISNFEYDALYDELVNLEKETGVVLAGSPTVSVGYEAVDELLKEAHDKPMLSLSKTKSRDELKQWLAENEALLSWKLDGLTIVLTYEKGRLVKAVTRGNGEVGEVITPNAKVFVNIPLQIPYQGSLILRGEAVITYSDFEKINAGLMENEEHYKNPRNLCSGSVRQLNSEITAKRNVRFYAFCLVKAEGENPEEDWNNDRENQFCFLKEQGFDVVEYVRVNKENILDAVENYEKKILTYDVPSDGLVLTLCDLKYAESLGRTAKFPKDSIAFKWQDETRETVLKEIEWSPSRTGLINPVAIFEPVELEGTTVSRASLHNISIMKNMKIGINDRIMVYKANMIIPQIAENLTKSGNLTIISQCPACGGETQIKKINDVESLYCQNPDCPAKKIKAFTLFTSRDAMNIEGLSEATLEKFIAKGFIHKFGDIFRLSAYRDEIVKMEGFGMKSYENLMENIQKARQSNSVRVLYGLGITGIGLANAKVLCRHFDYDIQKIGEAKLEEIQIIEGMGEVLAGAVTEWFAGEENKEILRDLLENLHLETPSVIVGEQVLKDKTFVITGDVSHFANRSELKEFIEERGGKVTGSVTGKTTYLINNDVNSTSGKNKKARELNVPVISEEEFLAMVGE